MYNQNQAQAYNKTYFDKAKKKAKKYAKEYYVMVKNFDSTAGGARKLIPKNKSPFIIAMVLRNDRFLLKDVEGFQVFQASKGVLSAQYIRPWIGIMKSF